MQTASAGVIALTIATSAFGAGWTSPERLRVSDGTESVSEQQVTLDPQGNAVVVWWEGSSGAVEAAIRPAGGAFTLVSPDVSQPAAGPPKVRLDAAGNATVAWTRGNAVQTATRPAGGTFGPPQDIPGAGTAPTDLDLAVDGQGRAIAMWRAVAPTRREIKAAVRPAGGSFAMATNVFGDNNPTAYEHALAMNAQGDAVAFVWIRFSQVVLSFRMLSANAWADGGQTDLGSVLLSQPTFDDTHPRVAVDPQGGAVLVWKRVSSFPPSTPSLLRTSNRPAQGSFTPGVDLPGTGVGSSYPEVAVDSNGNAIVLWSENGMLRSSYGPAGVAFGTPQDLPGSSDVTESRIVFLPDGTAVAAFYSPSNDQIYTSVRPLGGSWATATPIPTAEFAFSVELAVDGEGNVLAVLHESGATNAIAAAFYDPVPPRLDRLVVPTVTKIDQLTDFAAAPFDVVGPVGVEWDFGDGATAAGDPVSHAYAATGTYMVSVRATDSVGNQASTTSMVTVVVCISIPDCQATLDATLPDPNAAASPPARRAARKIRAFDREADAAIRKASNASGKRQAKRYRRARAALGRLLAAARKADEAGRLGVTLPPLEAAQTALVAFLPA